MNRPYMIIYCGKLAERHLTAKGALRSALRLVESKGWAIADIKIELEVK